MKCGGSEKPKIHAKFFPIIAQKHLKIYKIFQEKIVAGGFTNVL